VFRTTGYENSVIGCYPATVDVATARRRILDLAPRATRARLQFTSRDVAL